MPADRRSWRVALDEDLDQLLGRDAGEPGGSMSRGLEPTRDRLSRARLARAVVVPEPEVTRGPARGLAADDDGVEAQREQALDERLLFGGGDQVLLNEDPPAVPRAGPWTRRGYPASPTALRASRRRR